jgi:hypothetical protein
MNTTKLISHWSMSGALYDVDGRFRAIDDIGVAIEGKQPVPEQTAAAKSSFMIKGSDDAGWQPLGE